MKSKVSEKNEIVLPGQKWDIKNENINPSLQKESSYVFYALQFTCLHL